MATDVDIKKANSWPPWLRLFVVAVVLVMGSVVLMQRCLLPTTREYRRLIASADRVVIRFYLENNLQHGQDVVALTDKDEISDLAQSFRIKGIWLPLDDLIWRSYRVRCFHGQKYEDIIVRGGGSVRDKSGIWHAPITADFLRTIVRIVEDAGGTIPPPEELLKSNTDGITE